MAQRILFISCWNPTPINPNNGIFIRRHAEALVAVGCQVDFLTIDIHHGSKLFEVQFSREESQLTLEVSSLVWKFVYTGYPFIRSIVSKHLIPHLKSSDYDHIVSNVGHPTGIIGDYLGQKLDRPHAIIEHFSKTEFHLKHPIFGHSLKRIYGTASVVLPVSNFLQHAIATNAPQANCHVIPNVIDTDSFSYKEKSASDTIHFVAVAHWHQTKRQVKRPDLIIESLAKWNQIHLEKKLAIEFIGDGNMIAGMKQQAQSLGLEATFSGSQDAKYISATLQKATYFVHASMIETFSVVVVEALACGTPVIASRVGAIPDLIQSNNGVLADNTVEDWVAALDQAISINYDHEVIASQTANKYDKISVGKKILSALGS